MFALCCSGGWGQQPAVATFAAGAPVLRAAGSDALPEPRTAEAGTIAGLVKDTDAVAIQGAVVTLTPGEGAPLTTSSGAEGAFGFAEVPPGPYRLSVAMKGFESWSETGVLASGETHAATPVALTVLPVNAEVEVTASSREVAAAQLGFEEKQRVLGVFPNYYASYLWNADPLTARQKFALAWRFSVDPVAFSVTGVVAGAEQWQKGFAGYGPGARGYAKRYAATYADGFTSTMIGQAILPAVLHQDPRYFVKGTGSIPSRALYAVATAVICRGDNGRWQLNYSTILGNVAAASISNLYYPASSREGAGLTVENSLVGTALGAVGGLIQEFMLHRMTPNLPDYNAVAGQ